MCGAFGGGTGVRLELKVTPKPAAALRPIYYETSGSMTLLQEINDALRAAGENLSLNNFRSFVGPRFHFARI